MHPLAQRLVDGDVRALARVCRLADDGVGEYRQILKDLFPHTGGAWTIGVTGMPGAGKSTLNDQLIALLRASDLRVGVVAIDPTSPFSGGAILGDRIRMQRHHGDDKVFIRSLATRGALGGLSRSAPDVVRAVDAWGADVVLIETVGVGQDELEVTRTADTTLVIMAPGMGDDIQAIKAGILECADVFAVNKADREGADGTARQLELMISLGQSTAPVKGQLGHHGVTAQCGAKAERELAKPPTPKEEWVAPITMCVATQGKGVAELVTQLREHREWLDGTPAGGRRKLQRLREAMRNQLRNSLIDVASERMADALDAAVHAVAEKQLDPYTAAEQLVAQFRRGDQPAPADS